MTRGKPSPEQLDLANGMLAMPGNGDFHTANGEDGRNYGGLQGLPETRALFAPGLDVPADQIARLSLRGSSKFATPDDNGFVEQAESL